jgi:ribosome-associated protein
VSARVTLGFDLVNSPSLTEEDKALIAARLGSRIGKDGVLRVVSQETRSQAANRELAVERFAELLRAVLTPVSLGRKTRVGKEAKLRRLEAKKQRGRLKHGISKAPIED